MRGHNREGGDGDEIENGIHRQQNAGENEKTLESSLDVGAAQFHVARNHESQHHKNPPAGVCHMHRSEQGREHAANQFGVADVGIHAEKIGGKRVNGGKLGVHRGENVGNEEVHEKDQHPAPHRNGGNADEEIADLVIEVSRVVGVTDIAQRAIV